MEKSFTPWQTFNNLAVHKCVIPTDHDPGVKLPNVSCNFPTLPFTCLVQESWYAKKSSGFTSYLFKFWILIWPTITKVWEKAERHDSKGGLFGLKPNLATSVFTLKSAACGPEFWVRLSLPYFGWRSHCVTRALFLTVSTWALHQQTWFTKVNTSKSASNFGPIQIQKAMFCG